MELRSLLDRARALIKDPQSGGGRVFPPDQSKTPFNEIGRELAQRATVDFSQQVPSVGMAMLDWEKLHNAITWRVAQMLYELAFPENHLKE
jgi:hypothetical protein